MKSSSVRRSAQIFFTTETNGLAESRSVFVPLDQFNEYLIDMSENPFWTGNLRQLRLHPSSYGFAESVSRFISESRARMLVVFKDQQLLTPEHKFIQNESN
ncbi:MAG: hypothetical protein ABI477_20025 [Chryseolinea sp.]